MKEFITNPPAWMLAVLWLSFAFAALRLVLKLAVVQKVISALVMAKTQGLPVGPSAILGMCLRRTDPVAIVSALVAANRDDLGLTASQLEAQFLCGGDPGAVVSALALAKKHDMRLEFTEAAAIQLSGKDVIAEVQKALGINPTFAEDLLKERATEKR